MRTKAEKTLLQRNCVATESMFETSVQTVVGMFHAQLTRTEKGAFREKDHMLRNHSEDHKIGPVVHREYWV